MPTWRRVLVLFAHPAPARSEVNREMFRAARRLDEVTVVDLYAEYPRFDIDIDAEQERLSLADAVVFQFPFYWYSTPSILKEWQDLVLEYGFAYGEGGTALKGKLFGTAITTGGPEAAYHHEGYNSFTIREFLAPLEQTARLCSMHYLPPLVLHRARSALEEGRLLGHVELWVAYLTSLREGGIDAASVAELGTLNAAFALSAED